MGNQQQSYYMGRPMYKCVIYKIQNKVNGRCYIGQTRQGLVQRKREHLNRFHRGDRDHRIYLAFKKYGLDNFTWEVISQTTDYKLLDVLEQFFVEKYNSFENGYNCSAGGCSVSEETRLKISQANKGKSTKGHYHKILESRSKNLEDAGIKYYLLLTPEKEFLVVRNLEKWCRENKISRGNFITQGKKGKPNKGYHILECSTTSSFERTSQATGDGNGTDLVNLYKIKI